jgi:hypothetical protein
VTREPHPVDRRSLLAGALSGAIGAAMPVAAGAGVDPTLAAIDAHAEAYAELDRALGRQEELEGALLQRFGASTRPRSTATRAGPPFRRSWTHFTRPKRRPRYPWSGSGPLRWPERPHGGGTSPRSPSWVTSGRLSPRDRTRPTGDGSGSLCPGTIGPYMWSMIARIYCPLFRGLGPPSMTARLGFDGRRLPRARMEIITTGLRF